MKKRLVAPIIVSIVACWMLLLVGCSSVPTEQKQTIDYADDEAMNIIAKGWNDRSAVLEKGKIDSEDSEKDAANLREAVNVELSAISGLKNRQFEDLELQEYVIQYINAVDDQMAALNNYAITDISFYEKFNDAYDRRTSLLKTFYNDYGLRVDSKYSKEFDQILANGNAAELKSDQKKVISDLILSATWEKTESYGNYTYTAVIENTSDYNFFNIFLNVGLFDADNIKTESYASVTSWHKGEKVKFEAFSSKGDAQRVVAEISHFEVD